MAELLERWPGTVGEAIARNAWPARIARDGTVHVSTADSVWAFELGQRAAELAERLAVPKVRFAPGPLPEASLLAAPPLLLLDDVLSELDHGRRRILAERVLGMGQTVITATHASALPVEPSQVVEVEPGTAR